MEHPYVGQVKQYLLDLQNRICRQLELFESGLQFRQDLWERPGGGGGQTRVMADGSIFEKAGVNFSHVSGEGLPASATALRPALAGRGFEALGVSLVVHPWNPYLPTTHMNVRFFLALDKDREPIWWFGGGYDLTPFYPFMEDIRHWHRTAKAACDGFDPNYYPRFKRWCDEYFFLKHRNETRGVGGLFFDDFNEGGFEQSFAFMRAVGDSFGEAYGLIVQRRKDHVNSPSQRAFQLYRRGRYVEFNLIFDRGTIFGLQTGGRTESILMSLPPIVSWTYDRQEDPLSPEAALKDYLKPRDWLEECLPQAHDLRVADPQARI